MNRALRLCGIVAALVVLIPACKGEAVEKQTAAHADTCAKPQDCPQGLICGPKNTCISPAKRDCRRTDACKFDGLCSLRDGECIAASDADCKQSEACRAGSCTARAGACWSRGRTDAECRSKGKQGVNPCKHNGHCTAVDNVCTAASNADCKQSGRCKSHGYCTAKNGECIVFSGADCEQARNCQEYGRCAFKGGGCIVASDADCEKSKMCKDSGVCTASQGRCVYGGESDADCNRPRGNKNISPCKAGGWCKAKGGKCVVASDADCKKSVLCTKHRQCTLRDGKCLK